MKCIRDQTKEDLFRLKLSGFFQHLKRDTWRPITTAMQGPLLLSVIPLAPEQPSCLLALCPCFLETK